jgi:hypothetical protein
LGVTMAINSSFVALWQSKARAPTVTKPVLSSLPKSWRQVIITLALEFERQLIHCQYPCFFLQQAISLWNPLNSLC